MEKRGIKRLTVLKDEAENEPLPQRKYFHIGQPETMEDIGECIPMISWVEDNLSRYIVADAPSSAWGKSQGPRLFALPNHAVKPEDGMFLISGIGTDNAVPNPSGKGTIHFIHLNSPNPLWNKGLVKIYIYKLDGVQFKSLLEKKH